MPAMEMVHDVDPAKELFAEIGPLDQYQLAASNVLVAIYRRPDKTKTGIILTAQTQDEDLWQGKSGLVVALGPDAFVDSPEQNVVLKVKAKVGDWVSFRPSDTWQISINKVPCRMMSDVAVRMIVPSPDKVF